MGFGFHERIREFMVSLLCICPTKGRPGQALATLDSFERTRSGLASLFFVLESTDRHAYPNEILQRASIVEPNSAAVKWSKAVMENRASFDGFMFVGDDLQFETPAWDSLFMEELQKTNLFGIVQGDDGHFRNRSVSHPVIGRRLIAATGWAVLPGIWHYIDLGWTDLTKSLGLFRFMPEVRTPHLRWDRIRTKTDPAWIQNWRLCAPHDQKVYHEWLRTKRQEDQERVRCALKFYENNKETSVGAAPCGPAFK
jgi:hypothetical protein